MRDRVSPQDLAALKRDIFSSLHCALPGIVESFDAEAGTAVVRPALKRNSSARGAPGDELSCPLLCDVPVFMPVS